VRSPLTSLTLPFALVFSFALTTNLAAPTPTHAQSQTPKPTPQSPPKSNPAQQQSPSPNGATPGVATSPAVQAPSSKHYPILLLATGTEPFWSLRLGMKGPERLDRLNYPPIVLDPAEIVPDDAGGSWTYHAKDDATFADVTVKLVRENCSDNMSDTKYTFSVVVEHAQLGTLKGCGISAPDKFPEFLKKNQIDDADSLEPVDKDKQKEKERNKALDPITKFVSPTAIAYIDASGKIIVARGQVRKTAAPSGQEPALSHDGKKLLYTRSDSKTGPDRSLMLFDFDSGRSTNLAGNNVRQGFWSLDDSRVAYLKFDNNLWQIWTLPTDMPSKTAAIAPQNIDALHGWTSPNTVLATDKDNAYWIADDGKPQQTVPLKDIYGSAFQIMSSDTIRVHPLNPDLLLVSAYYANTPAGAPTDSVGLNSTFFLYEIKSKRRVILGPSDSFSRAAEWSRDGLQIFFTRGVPGKAPLATFRIFWDGTTLRRYVPASDLVVGK
jgi:uncharacterized membrane protein/Tol biopolymer transport system component